MKTLLTALSILALAVACNRKDSGSEFQQKQQEVNKEYREEVKDANKERKEEMSEAREDLREEQKEEAKEYIDEGNGAVIDRVEEEVEVVEPKKK